MYARGSPLSVIFFSSGGERRQFMGWVTRPVRPQAKYRAANSTELRLRTPMRSPLARPRPVSPLASRRTWRSNSAQVTRRPVVASTMAVPCGVWRAHLAGI